MPPFRFVHFSDIHLPTPPGVWRPRDLLTKRATGWVNTRLLGRGLRFGRAAEVFAALLDDLRKRPPDALVFSGDATVMGFPGECAAAWRRIAAVPGLAGVPGVAVPGNHDYYTAESRGGGFEAAFAPWQEGTRVGGEAYPFARKLGPAWFVAVNSATPNRGTFDASGEVGAAQLGRLRELCARLGDGPRVLVTHYPLLTAARTLEGRFRRLRDRAAVLAAARDCGVGLWLHGHIHRGYVLWPGADVPFAQICAGSATQTNRWMVADCVLEGGFLSVTRRVFDPRCGEFRPHASYRLPLPGFAARGLAG